MKSLTVFDPEKVFTEVIKPNPATQWQGGALLLYAAVTQWLRCGDWKHNMFFLTTNITRTFNVLGFKLEIEDIPVVRITGRVSKRSQYNQVPFYRGWSLINVVLLVFTFYGRQFRTIRVTLGSWIPITVCNGPIMNRFCNSTKVF